MYLCVNLLLVGVRPLATGDDIVPSDNVFPTYSIGEGIMSLSLTLEDNNITKNSITFQMNKKQTGWLNPYFFYLFELYVDIMEESTPNIDSDSRELLSFGDIMLINTSPYSGFDGTVDGIE